MERMVRKMRMPIDSFTLICNDKGNFFISRNKKKLQTRIERMGNVVSKIRLEISWKSFSLKWKEK